MRIACGSRTLDSETIASVNKGTEKKWAPFCSTLQREHFRWEPSLKFELQFKMHYGMHLINCD